MQICTQLRSDRSLQLLPGTHLHLLVVLCVCAAHACQSAVTVQQFTFVIRGTAFSGSGPTDL